MEIKAKVRFKTKDQKEIFEMKPKTKRLEGELRILKNGTIMVGEYQVFGTDEIVITAKDLKNIIKDAKEGLI